MSASAAPRASSRKRHKRSLPPLSPRNDDPPSPPPKRRRAGDRDSLLDALAGGAGPIVSVDAREEDARARGARAHARDRAEGGDAAVDDGDLVPPPSLAWSVPAFEHTATRPDGYDVENASGQVTGEDARFCYACSVSTHSARFLESINRSFEEGMKRYAPNQLCRAISAYYDHVIRDRLPHRLPWDPATVYAHFTSHVVSPHTTFVMALRHVSTLARLALVNSCRRTDKGGVVVDDANADLYLRMLAVELRLAERLARER